MVESAATRVALRQGGGRGGPRVTCCGRIDTGFEFLGYHVGPEGLRVARKTVERFVARAHQLYEQEPGECVSARLGAYVRRWVWS